jgi:hypothetical protein
LKTFGKKETIGGFAQQKMALLRERFMTGRDSFSDTDKLALIDEVNYQLGDSVEKVLLIKFYSLPQESVGYRLIGRANFSTKPTSAR